MQKHIINTSCFQFMIACFFVLFSLEQAYAVCQIDPNGTYIEAEHFTHSYNNGNTSTNFTVVSDSGTNNGQVLVSGAGGTASTTPQGEYKGYEVYFAAAGNYEIWMRGEGYSGSQDSMFFGLNGGSWKAWNFGGTYDNYIWTSSMQVGTGNFISVPSVGTHIINIGVREQLSRIDGFYIDLVGNTPTDASVPSSVTSIDPRSGCSGPFLAATPALLAPTSYVGYNASNQTLVIENTGTTDFIGTIVAEHPTFVNISGWNVDAANPLSSGESITLTISYTTSSLVEGAYSSSVTVDGNAQNDPFNIPITLIVDSTPISASCGEIPLYAENLVNPAIMVQLDTSGSMSSSMPVLTDGTNPVSPDLKSIVQEIVNQAGWVAENAMAFSFQETSGDYRRAWSYDGLPNAAPQLYIKYTVAGITTEIEQRVTSAIDDVRKSSASVDTNDTYLDLGTSDPVGLRFASVDIPNGATIDEADITFVIHSGTSSDTSVSVSGILSIDAPVFTTAAQLTTGLTTANASWAISSWGASQSRIAIAEDVLAEVFEDRSISWGFGTWAGGTGSATDSDNSPTYYTNYRIGVHDHDDDHQTNLQDIVNDGSPSGWTPLTPTLKAGLAYFQGTRNDSFYSESYSALSCQPRILVVVTDGVGNTATTLDNVKTSTQALIDEGVSVVVVGFGIPPEDAAQIYAIAKIAQEEGDSDGEDMLYGLHDEIGTDCDPESNFVTGDDCTGIPFIAQSREDFINAMQDIVTNVKAQVFQGSNPAPTTSVDDGEVLLTAMFDASDWSGNISAIKFDPLTGILDSTTFWDAESMMPASPNAYIWDTASSTVTLYTDASLTGDNFICKPLGDIINSTPHIVGAPPFFYTFNGYRSFKYDIDAMGRDTVAYVGSNDGALHAFNLHTGSEKWRYYPNGVRNALNQALTVPNKDMCSPSYCHDFLVDGSPQAADIFNGTEWKTILMTGLGRGGQAFFTLDVTYGENMGAATTNKSTRLWEFSDSDASELGLSTSISTITRTGGEVWAAFFGSGNGITAIAQATKKAYLFGVKAWDKGYIWKDVSDADTYKIKLSDTVNNAPNSPLCVNLQDDDQQIDHIYIGDLYGDLFRVENVGNGEQPTVSTFFDSTNTDHSSPITGKSGFAYGGDDDDDDFFDVWIYFGTGRYEEQIDKVSSDQQYFFGLKDVEGGSSHTMATLTTFQTDIVVAKAVDSDGNVIDSTVNEFRTITGINPTGNSWVLELFNATAPSERVFTKPLVVGGVVFFTSFIPDGDVCEGNGDAYLFALDTETGLPVESIFDINGDGVFDENDQVVEDSSGTKHSFSGFHVGKGKPTDPVIHNDILFVGTVSGDGGGGGTPPKTFKVDLDKLKSRIKAWQQKFN